MSWDVDPDDRGFAMDPPSDSKRRSRLYGKQAPARRRSDWIQVMVIVGVVVAIVVWLFFALLAALAGAGWR